MERLVKIYVLIDPFTLKVRYIGRTTCTLSKRLGEHISKAKKYNCYSHKENWIRSLLKVNSKPYIRQIALIKGWKESYNIECKLIKKYQHRLLNAQDRGEGAMRNLSPESKQKISDTLKENYKKGMSNPARKKVYAYNRDGSFYKEYDSIRIAAKDLGYYYKVISKQLNSGVSPKYLRKQHQFSWTKFERMNDYNIKKS